MAISQPGHAHKLESISCRYSVLKEAGILGIVYLADNDEKGEEKASKCQQAANKGGLSFIIVKATEAWKELPGSVGIS